MALDADDLARLGRIESDLASADPDFARRLRSWRPSAEQRALVPGWSVLPRWVLEVFLVGFAGWVLPVPVSVVVVGLVALVSVTTSLDGVPSRSKSNRQ